MAAPGNVYVKIVADTSRFEAAMRDLVATTSAIAARWEKMLRDSARLRRMIGAPLRDRDHPPALMIDGAAYHRRRNARRRRR